MSNDFLPFAVGGSANVTPQSTYAANTTLTQGGFSSGIAKSPDLNKVWRQSSIMSAVVAQFIVNQTGANATDDGTTATLIANLLVAIRNAGRQSVIVTGAGSANTYAAVNSPALTVLPSSGFVQQITIPAANTGASTFAPDGLAAKPILGLGNAALQGGELPASSVATMMYIVAPTVNAGNGAWIILECTGGALQIAPATASQHAVQLGQLTGLVGSMRNAKMSVTAASATATFTADQIVVGTALNGLEYLLPSYSQTINLATTGAGGMDTGAAPASGYVSLYAIYKPSTATTSILATNTTSSVPPTIYGGANMPAGYTASALIGIWGTTSGSLYRIGIQRERRIYFPALSVLSGGTATAYTSTSIAAAVPFGAKSWGGNANVALTAAVASNGIFIAGDANDTGLQTAINPVGSSSNSSGGGINNVPIITEQVMFYKNTIGSASSNVTVSSYEF